jgi:hypothetical protein
MYDGFGCAPTESSSCLEGLTFNRVSPVLLQAREGKLMKEDLMDLPEDLHSQRQVGKVQQLIFEVGLGTNVSLIDYLRFIIRLSQTNFLLGVASYFCADLLEV